MGSRRHIGRSMLLLLTADDIDILKLPRLPRLPRLPPTRLSPPGAVHEADAASEAAHQDEQPSDDAEVERVADGAVRVLLFLVGVYHCLQLGGNVEVVRPVAAVLVYVGGPERHSGDDEHNCVWVDSTKIVSGHDTFSYSRLYHIVRNFSIRLPPLELLIFKLRDC